MPVGTLLALVLLIGVIIFFGALGVKLFTSIGPRRLTRNERLRLERAESTLERIYDAACDERELSTMGSPFADVVIDEVRSYRRSNRELEG